MGPGDPFGASTTTPSHHRGDGPVPASPRLASGAALGVLFGIVVLLKGFVAAFFVVGCAIAGAGIAQVLGRTRLWNFRAAWRALIGGSDA